ncbi:hypothetical protein Tco_0658021 [Tanacetum coccineum]
MSTSGFDGTEIVRVLAGHHITVAAMADSREAMMSTSGFDGIEIVRFLARHHITVAAMADEDGFNMGTKLKGFMHLNTIPCGRMGYERYMHVADQLAATIGDRGAESPFGGRY